jgi:hypothetical protein
MGLISVSLFAHAQRWSYNWDIKAHDRGQLKFQIGAGIQRSENKYWFYKPGLLFNRPSWASNGGDNGFEIYLSQINFLLRSTGPYIARLEYGLNRTLSVSVGGTYVNYDAKWTKQIIDNNTGTLQPANYGVNVGNIGIVSRLNFHPIVNTHWDVYLGGGPGYDLWMKKDYTNNAKDSLYNSAWKPAQQFFYDYGAGARYYFRRRSAIFAEVGYGKSYGNVGVILKILQPKSNRIY